MLARELARSALTLNFYTEWYWKTDLHNLLHFLALRLDPHAQYEIRVYAEVIAAMVRDWCPFAWEAFEDFRVGAVSLSRQEAEMLRDSLRVTGFMVPPSPALSQKDIQAFLARLLPPPVGGE
jgi:thymidylate synthase (FAD)